MISSAEKQRCDDIQMLASQESERLMPFGRYRGQPVEVLRADRPYLRWLLAQSWFVDGPQQALVQTVRALLDASCQGASDQEAERWYLEGMRLKILQHRRDALKAFEQALAIDPHHLETLLEKASLEWPEQALRTLDQALQFFPAHPRLLKLKASQLEGLERYREAIETYEKILTHLSDSAANSDSNATDPAMQECHYAFGLCLMKWGSLTLQEGFFDETLRAMKRLHQFMEGEPTTWRIHSLALIEMRRPAEALPWLDKALRANPSDDRCWKARGRAMHALGRFPEAIAALEKSVLLQENDQDSWFILGLSYDELDQWNASSNAFGRALAIEPTDGFFWYSRGSALYNLGRYVESLSDLEEAYSRDPELTHALFLKSMCLSHLGQYDEAIVAATRVIDLNPRNDEALYNRACYFSKCGDRDRALEDLRQAIGIDTEWRDAALEDEDFDALRADGEFRCIVS